ncbi:uncharacterized protein LOC125547432 [Triticum urartu]|uniref:uncharacterized protein LOC125547432 n=1 Tax=Triticum urartu TaxID=4572 RepID=UPI00204465B7|nr:uncharacterized protein LOC125547432 [Triticum urartu]
MVYIRRKLVLPISNCVIRAEAWDNKMITDIIGMDMNAGGEFWQLQLKSATRAKDNLFTRVAAAEAFVTSKLPAPDHHPEKRTKIIAVVKDKCVVFKKEMVKLIESTVDTEEIESTVSRPIRDKKKRWRHGRNIDEEQDMWRANGNDDDEDDAEHEDRVDEQNVGCDKRYSQNNDKDTEEEQRPYEDADGCSRGLHSEQDKAFLFVWIIVTCTWMERMQVCCVGNKQ